MRPSALSFLLLLITACSGPPESAARTTRNAPEAASGGVVVSGIGRPLTPGEAEAFEALLDAAQHIRRLRFLRPVQTRVQSRQEIVEFVRSRIERDELEHARLFYVALGLLPEDLDIERMILAVMGEQIVGYYDPRDHVMVAREDVVAELGRSGDAVRQESALVLIHEYVHALQDQHHGLHQLQEIERTIDGENAFASLVEGDATLAMIGWIFEAQGHRLSTLTRDPTLLANVISSSPAVAGGAELEAAPAIVRAPLLSRYLDGLVFCGSLHGQGGFRWIDEAFSRPPVSTEQVLHPDRWLSAEMPETFDLPPYPELERAGLSVHDEDTLGELELSVYFAQGTGADRDRSAADGWGGDRIRVYTRADRTTAAVWLITWDTEADAIVAEHAAAAVRDRAPPSRAAMQRVERQGRALLILRDLEPALHDAVLTPFRAWADRIQQRSAR